MSLYTIIAIAAGGAAGAVMRHGVNIGAARFMGTDFPWGTLTVNIAGSFLMGVLIASFAHFWDMPQLARAFMVTGMLGAFTTFSAFSLDVSVLFEGGRLMEAALYVLCSVVLAVGALFAGLFAVRVFAL
jgi:CrcB protein